MKIHITSASGLRTTSCILAFAALIATGACNAIGANPFALKFDGANDYVTFGAAPSLGGSNFTVECWFRRLGAGVSTTTGSGGVTAVPLVSKGRGEFDGDNRDMNYFLGISTNDLLVADFEEAASGANPGLNHPISGRTAIVTNTWYHAAATYDGTNLVLYLNGVVEAQLTVMQPPRWDSIQHAGVGTALNSSGTPAGFFNGVIDEVRIWTRAVSAGEVAAQFRQELPDGLGLFGCWHLNQGTGTTASNSAGTVHGTLVNGPVWVTGGPAGNPLPSVPDNALSLNGSEHVTFGPAIGFGGLGLSQFTLETFFKRTGTGTVASTGSGGVSAIPLITKGRGEADGDNRDMNYFLGIQQSNNVLVADFEEANTGLPGNTPGLNHPIAGVTPILSNVWYHAAATYDGTNWQLFLNGNLETSLSVGQPPRSDSIQHAALGTAMNSSGVAQGHFQGRLDEVRIWNYARNSADVWAGMQVKIENAPGLAGKWGLNESNGVVAADAANRINGNIAGAGFGFPPADIAPAAATLQSPANGATQVPLNTTLSANVSVAAAETVTATFYGRTRLAPPPPDFTLVMIPDTQFFVQGGVGGSGGLPAMFERETMWIRDNREAENIVYIAHVGDCVQNANTTEFNLASSYFSTYIEPFGIPYGIAVGNHDQNPANAAMPPTTTTAYNAAFGIARFTGRSYWAGHFGDTDSSSQYTDNNDNHFDLFSGGSNLHFIVIYLEFNQRGNADEIATENAAIAWADSKLRAYPDRKGIVVSHSILTGTTGAFTSGSAGGSSGSGQFLYDGLKNNPNLTLMLCGHTGPSWHKTLPTVGGNSVHIIMADYQGDPRGGNGYLRRLKFKPTQNQIHVTTYSPYQQYVIGHDDPSFPIYKVGAGDTADEFDLDYEMGGLPFKQIGSSFVLTTTTTIQVPWNNLTPLSTHDWYVATRSGTITTTSAVRSFTTKTSGYSIYDLGTLGGSSSWAHGINSVNQIVGESLTATGARHAFRVDVNYSLNMNDLGLPISSVASVAYAANAEGRAVGYVESDENTVNAYRNFENGWQSIGTLGGSSSVAYDINEAGYVVGWADVDASTHHAFLIPGSPADLGTLGGENSWAYGINNSGQIVGTADLSATVSHAFRTDSYSTIPDSGPSADLGTLGGLISVAHDINDAGQVVGYSTLASGPYYRAFRTAANSPIASGDDLGTLDGDLSVALGINDSGDIVGWSTIPTGEERAFIYKGSGSWMVDLNTYLVPNSGWILTRATAINGYGSIVGYGLLNGQTHAFLLRLDPIP